MVMKSSYVNLHIKGWVDHKREAAQQASLLI
jgi:hypothetical protein